MAGIRPVVGILAGGRSRRMGADKALLEMGGETLLERTLRVAAEAGLEAAVAGRPAPPGPAHLVEAAAGPVRYGGVRFLPDETPGRGPLGGIITLLRSLDRPVLALPVDLGRLRPEALAWLAGEAERHMLADGVAVRDAEHRLQPLFSVYTPLVIPLAEKLLAEGRAAPREVLAAGRFRLLELPERFSGDLTGVDTPEDWAGLTK